MLRDGTPVVGNNLKRFFGWLDSFKYDAFASEIDLDKLPLKGLGRHNITEKMKKEESSYFEAVLFGAVKTIRNGFSSPNEDKVDQAKAKHKVV